MSCLFFGLWYTSAMMKHYDGLALFSGGLDSILAARLMMEQGKSILCLHFTSPFFGDARAVPYWSKKYGLEITAVDISEDYCQMLCGSPANGFGSALNPCVDCKIIMMQKAKELMPQYGAKFLVSGEVLGQRPMSQRRDTLNVIRRDADVKDILLRPLCAKLMDPLPVELSGEVDREKLLGIYGRSRKEQLALAERFNIADIPTAGGGCKLTEKENARRYYEVMQKVQNPTANDFFLANHGRQLWNGDIWVSLGRKQADNEQMQQYRKASDYILRIEHFPSPYCIVRHAKHQEVGTQELAAVGALLASYSNKACAFFEQQRKPVSIKIEHNGSIERIGVVPERREEFKELHFDEIKEILQKRKKNTAE